MKKIRVIILILIIVFLLCSCPLPPARAPSYELKIENCFNDNTTFMFTKRAYHSILLNDYYLIGGTQDGITGLNDVWYSNNGSNWQLVTSNAGFSPRWAHTSVIKDFKIWVIGGTSDGQTGLNDVWYSIWYEGTGGVDWELATGNAGFSGRWGHTSVIKDNKIWVIGGTTDGSTGLNDVWYSENGVDWILATSNAGFSGRWHHASIVISQDWVENIYVIGGTEDGVSGLNDVWYSNNGIEWKKVTGNAEFGKRYGHKCAYIIYHEDNILIIGGKDNNKYYNDIWCSEDMKTWKKMEHSCPFNPMVGFDIYYEYNQQYMYIYGGYDGNNYLDSQWIIYFKSVVVN